MGLRSRSPNPYRSPRNARPYCSCAALARDSRCQAVARLKGRDRCNQRCACIVSIKYKTVSAGVGVHGGKGQGDRKGPHPAPHHSRPYKTLLANAIERRFPSSSRATTRVAPTMDGPGEPLPTWHGRGDPRGRPAGSLHALVLLPSHCHSPAKSYNDTPPCDTPRSHCKGGSGVETLAVALVVGLLLHHQ